MHGDAALPRLPPATEIALFRIVQEALANLLKHAGATHVDIGLAAAGGGLRIVVADDGRGFDAERAYASAASWGMKIFLG